MPASIYQKFSGSLTPLPDHVLVCNMQTGEYKTSGGIIVTDDNGKDRGIHPRWCQVYKVGENVTGFTEGEWILMEHGRWTWAFDFFDEQLGQEVKVQRIDIKGAMLSSDTKPF